MGSRHDIDPKVPGLSPTCIDHEEALQAEAEERGKLTRELATIQHEIGKAPDPTGHGDEREGHGIKGTLTRILTQLEALTKRVEELTKIKSQPPPATANHTWGQRVGWVLLILALGVREARSFYTEFIATHSAHAAPSSHVLP
jgi:hypothetical protein